MIIADIIRDYQRLFSTGQMSRALPYVTVFFVLPMIGLIACGIGSVFAKLKKRKEQ